MYGTRRGSNLDDPEAPERRDADLAPRRLVHGLCSAGAGRVRTALLRPARLPGGGDPVAEEIHWVHDYVNAIIFAITAFVMLLMLYVMWRFSEKRNPVPSRTTHNTTIEVLWTVLPVLILVAIAIPSFRLLYKQYSFPPPGLTIKAIGQAWNWTHEVPRPGHLRRFDHAAGQ
jgi:cytochrome c oxidase subunit 2